MNKAEEAIKFAIYRLSIKTEPVETTLTRLWEEARALTVKEFSNAKEIECIQPSTTPPNQ